MGVGYSLVNISKKEKICYYHLPANTAKELTGNPVTSAITTWYLLKNCGDNISFVPDQYNEECWPFKDIVWEDIDEYNDLTDEIINELINLKVLRDDGTEFFDIRESDVYLRRLQNIWFD